MTTENLRLLRTRLRYGDREAIAKELSLSTRTVYNVLYGIQNNPRVLELAIKLAEEHTAYEAETNARVELIFSNSSLVA